MVSSSEKLLKLEEQRQSKAEERRRLKEEIRRRLDGCGIVFEVGGECLGRKTRVILSLKCLAIMKRSESESFREQKSYRASYICTTM